MIIALSESTNQTFDKFEPALFQLGATRDGQSVDNFDSTLTNLPSGFVDSTIVVLTFRSPTALIAVILAVILAIIVLFNLLGLGVSSKIGIIGDECTGLFIKLLNTALSLCWVHLNQILDRAQGSFDYFVVHIFAFIW